MNPVQIDLNGDVGEGRASDARLIPLLTSANIACGGHAGDDASMRRAVRQALESGVAVGAHPSFPDRENFGRIARHAAPSEITAWVAEQIAALESIAKAEGAKLRHVKPHGALYNLAATDATVAGAIVEGIRRSNTELILFALPHSALENAGLAAGLHVAREGFVERHYRCDGTLVPRDEPHAIIHQGNLAIDQAVKLALGEPMLTAERVWLKLKIDTLCLHGDHPRAVSLAHGVRAALAAKGIAIERVFN